MRSSHMTARTMSWIYLIIPIGFVALTVALGPIVATIGPGHRARNGRRLTLDIPSDASSLTPIDGDHASVCVICSCPVVDDVTHWKAIHRVPA